MWLCIFTGFLILAIVMGHNYIEAADADPILFSLQSYEIEVDELPFPTVSFCSSSSLTNNQAQDIDR
jgi:hypothetical protein